VGSSPTFPTMIKTLWTRPYLGLPLHVWLIAATFVFICGAVQYVVRLGFREYEQRVERVTAQVDSLTERADSLAAAATRATERGDSLADVAAQTRARVITRLVHVLDTLPPAPDTCAAYIAPRDEAIDSLEAVIDEQSNAYAYQQDATARLMLAYRLATEASDSLSAVLKDRPRLPPLWMPKVSGGVFAGVCTTGPCAGVGIGLTWDVPLSRIF
jgi:hypothetical protein